MKRIADVVRTHVEHALRGEMERVDRELAERAPVPLSSVPPLEELQRILAALQARRPSVKPYLQPAP